MSKTLSNNRKLKNAVIVLALILGSVIIALSVMLTVFIAKTNTYKLQLENNYKRNFYELISDINQLEINMSKLIATNSIKSQKQLLTDIYDTSKTSSVNLSALPIANHKIDNNLFGRTIFNYIQINEDITNKINADIPLIVKQKLSTIFNQGITIWNFFGFDGLWNDDDPSSTYYVDKWFMKHTLDNTEYYGETNG